MYRAGLILIFLWQQMAAQDIHFSSEYASIIRKQETVLKSGAKNSRVLLKDSRKLLWLGTENGLYRYDGTNVLSLRHREGDFTSIPSNNIVSILEDRKGNIWLGTMGGVARLDPYSLKCTVFRQVQNNIQNDYDNKIMLDGQGNLWTGNSSGLEWFDEKQKKFRRIWQNDINNLPYSSYVTCLSDINKDSLIFGTFGDMVMINKKDFGYRRIHLIDPYVTITSIYVDPLKNKIWVGTWEHGIIVGNISMTSFKVWKWKANKKENQGFIVSGFTEASTSAGSFMWVNAGYGMMRIPLDKTYAPDFTQVVFYENDSRHRDQVSCMLTDEDGFFWLGGSFGLAIFTEHESTFHQLPVKFKGFIQDIQQVQLNSIKKIVISTWHGKNGLILLDSDLQHFSEVKNFQRSPDDYNSSGLALDRMNRLWEASLGGLKVMDQNFKVTYDFAKAAHTPDSLNGTKISKVFIVHDTVWVLCYKKGIELYDLNFHKIKGFSESDGLKENLFWNVFKDSHDRIWIIGNGYFYRYLPAAGRFRSFDFNHENNPYSPIDIAESADGTLWIATGSGLFHFDPSTETFNRLSTTLLQKDENILSVCVDSNDDIWFLNRTHLFRYRPSINQYSMYGEEDGLDNSDMQWIRTFDGRRILLAQMDKLYSFEPSQWVYASSRPGIYMYSVQINDSLAAPVKNAQRLDLHYDQNKIYFEFDGINYIKPEQNRYAYRLDGIDKSWVLTEKNFASYANLSPGEYQFHVKLANYSGVWSKELIMYINITPPFWKTWWFISLMVLALGSVFFIVIRYISQRNLRERILVLEKEQAVEKERNRIAGDMHDDLGSGLTKIAILSEVAKAQINRKEEAINQLEKISVSSRELIDNLQDIIWVLNPKNDSLESLSLYIREYALKFFESTNIKVHFDYPQQLPAVKLSEEERRNIFLVIKETLNNMVKHARCSCVHIEIRTSAREIMIIMKDNGIGFELSSIRGFANGLNNMAYRMEQINASYKIESSSSNGTITILKIRQ